jgi:hypothetical protein
MASETETLALHLVRALYDSTDGLSTLAIAASVVLPVMATSYF